MKRDTTMGLALAILALAVLAPAAVTPAAAADSASWHEAHAKWPGADYYPHHPGGTAAASTHDACGNGDACGSHLPSGCRVGPLDGIFLAALAVFATVRRVWRWWRA